MALMKKGVGLLIVTLFVGVLIGGAFGQIFGIFFGIFLPADHPATDVLVKPLVDYQIGPITIDLIVMRFTFDWAVRISFFSILGIMFAWYYYKYYY